MEKGELAIILGASNGRKATTPRTFWAAWIPQLRSCDGRWTDITTYGKKQLTQYRRTDIGFVFQFYNLVSEPDRTGKCGIGFSDLQ